MQKKSVLGLAALLEYFLKPVLEYQDASLKLVKLDRRTESARDAKIRKEQIHTNGVAGLEAAIVSYLVAAVANTFANTDCTLLGE